MIGNIAHIENVVQQKDAITVSVDSYGVITIQRSGVIYGCVTIDARDVADVAESLVRMSGKWRASKGFHSRREISPKVAAELDKIADVLGIERRHR